ncbi:MAG: ATP-dependent Clp protease ATP-binding subunit [Victivallales bacterium]|nr:ATP-dependent Clp protease ATP-binding subunit [Victivallales bacterium]
MSDIDRFYKLFTPRVEQVFALAVKEAREMGNGEVACDHVLLGILGIAKGTAYSCLQSFGVTYEKVKELVNEIHPSEANQPDPPISAEVIQMLKHAEREARTINYTYIGVEQLLLGLLFMNDGSIVQIWERLSVDKFELRNEVLKALDKSFLPPSPQDMINMLNNFLGEEPPQGEQDEQGKPGESKPSRHFDEGMEEPAFREGPPQETRGQALKTYGRDLTELAAQGKLDPVIGRTQEIERVMQILCRRTKNNAVLIGEAGVGKTAIVEGLAQAIIAGNVPSLLQNKKVVALDLTLLVAGTKYRGQFEERIKNVLDELRRSKKVILFLDELHTIVNAGNSDGGLDVSNILKPALARGEIQCVGATTMKEYRKTIEKDTALERRFQPVTVQPPNAEEALLILKGLAPRYETHHNVKYPEAVLRTAIELSVKYLPSRHLPDKVIDVMDEAGAFIHIRQSPADTGLQTLERQLDEIKTKKSEALAASDFTKSKELWEQERSLEAKLKETKSDKEASEAPVEVTVEDIRRVVSSMSGVPLTQMAEDETARLLRMEEELSKTVIGQDAAVKSISRALRRARAELKDPRRPIGSFIFLGPTGVGKTLLAKALAEFMFGSADALIRVDMSEYMEKHSVSRMIGTAPGYVGYDDGGQLTERIKRKPYSVVLFDEIEKAHPDVTNIMLQIMEEGQLTDGNGVQVSFRNAIIVYTSNLGAERITKGASLGFAGSADNRSEKDASRAHDMVMDAAKQYFRPEFLNRLDDIIVFRNLEKPDFERIVDIEIDKVRDLLKPKNATLVLDPKVREMILEQGSSAEFGARLYRRQVERLIEDPLSDAILAASVKEKFQAVGHPTPDGKAVVFDIVPAL